MVMVERSEKWEEFRVVACLCVWEGGCKLQSMNIIAGQNQYSRSKLALKPLALI